jgi:hypothetical protein
MPSLATIDPSSGSLIIAGRKIFPLIMSDPPAPTAKTPDGNDAWAELRHGGLGANFIRSGRTLANPWNIAQIDQQIADERARMDAAHAQALHCWLRLVNSANLPTPSGAPSAQEQILVKLANAFKGHDALGAYKGADEPEHGNTPPDGLQRAYQKLKTLDPDHPLAIIQAPTGPVANLLPYRPAFDITGADIYPIAYGHTHSDLPNHDISVVGDVTKKMVSAGGGKPVWMTLQIAWSGIIPTTQHPETVPRFPSLSEMRFMAYQAIVNGARGLAFFGGQYTQVMRPRDASTGWNWTFWQLVLLPVLIELNSPTVQPALVAPLVAHPVTTTATDVELTTRTSGNYLYVIAVRRSSTTTNKVPFAGLPAKNDGTQITTGEVAFEYAQEPPAPPTRPEKQRFRKVAAANGAFDDWLGPHDARVYRFSLS